MKRNIKDEQRVLCHARARGSDGHEPVHARVSLEDVCVHCKRPISNVLGVWMLKKGEPEVEMRDENKGRMRYIDAAGKLTNCERCGAMCRVADKRNIDARPFRLAEKPNGVCASCVMTQFLYNTYPVNLQIDEAGPALLLKPGIREAFLACGMLDHSDLNINEVNWNQVVTNWHLPIPIIKDPRNPYRMGDSPRSYLKTRAEKRGEDAVDPMMTKWGRVLAENNGVLSGEAGRQFMEETGLRALLDQASGTVQ